MPILVWLHLLAAVAWIGGMVFLSLVLVPVVKREPFASQRGALIRAAALRFRLVVWAAVALLLTTGPLLAMHRGWSLGEPGGWPVALAVKLTLVAILLLLTVAHDFFIGPRIGRILQLPEPSRTGRDRLLVAGSSWLPRLSLLLALAVLGAAVVLTRL
jgi:copper resistance protein D